VSALPAPLRAVAPDQICFLVDDLAGAVGRYAEFSRTRFDHYEVDDDIAALMKERGAPARTRIRYALSRTMPQIELIEPHSGEGLYDEHIAAVGLGFHHLGYNVTELDPYREAMAAAGFEPIFEGEGMGASADGAFVYYDTIAELGHLVELILPPTRRLPALATT
jgi:methylmalonyl-CoA/ethylmalonyl-CoA epimerase